jgi:hypothetical protein
MGSRRKEQILSIGNGPKPGDFPLGSVESRAAARSLVQQKAEIAPRVWIFHNGALAHEYENEGMELNRSSCPARSIAQR